MLLRHRLSALLTLALALAFGACASTSPPEAVAAPGGTETPEQRYADWTSLPFEREELAQRRVTLASSQGAGLYLIPSRAGASQGETFRQLDDFYYLTGLELPDSLLAIDVPPPAAAADPPRDQAPAHVIMFAPPRDARFESSSRRNDFPGRPLQADPTLAGFSGLDAAHHAEWRPIAELQDFIAAHVAAGSVLWIDFGRRGALIDVPDGLLDTRSPAEALAFQLQQRWPGARLRNAHDALAQQRMVKSADEVRHIRKACALTADGILAAAALVGPGVDERTLAAEFEATCKRGGAQRMAFDSIVKSGPNSLWPWRILATHDDRRNRTLQAGELVILDVGCEVDHYASDAGRTFPVSGHFSDEQRRRLAMVTAASDAVIAAVRPGVTFAELQRIALAEIPPEERPFMQAALYFGHHIGLDAGDSSLEEAPLRPGMTFTIEPWYYNHAAGIAVFIEDDLLVTEDGVENLTAALPRRPEELEALVRSSARQPAPR